MNTPRRYVLSARHVAAILTALSFGPATGDSLTDMLGYAHCPTVADLRDRETMVDALHGLERAGAVIADPAQGWTLAPLHGPADDKSRRLRAGCTLLSMLGTRRAYVIGLDTNAVTYVYRGVGARRPNRVTLTREQFNDTGFTVAA